MKFWFGEVRELMEVRQVDCSKAGENKLLWRKIITDVPQRATTSRKQISQS